MNRFLVLLNIGLALGAVSLTLWALQPSVPPELPQPPVVDEDAGGEAVVKTAVQIPYRLGEQTHDVLWEKTLFSPGRKEASVDAAGAAAGVEAVPEVDLELIGIGVVGKESAAVILIKGRMRGPARGRADGQEGPRTQHVYRLDQMIEETGWKVAAIGLNGVTLRRGEEEKVLEMKTGDADSAARVTAASLAARDTEKAAEAPKPVPAKVEAAVVQPPPPPPPPPPMPTLPSAVTDGGFRGNVEAPPGASGQVSVTVQPGGEAAAAADSEATREERIRKALELRRQILENRRRENSTTR